MTHSSLRFCTVAPDGPRFSLADAGSILDSALAEGVAVPFSCKRGECGSCRAQLLEGSFERIAPPSETAYQVAHDELLICQCRATSDLRLRFAHWQVPPRPAARHGVKILRLDALAPGVMRLVVEVQSAQPFHCLPGQHAQLMLDNGERRSFSIANLPAESGDANRLEFHVRRIPGGAFTDLRLAQLQPGDVLELDGPHGACTWQAPGEAVEHLVLLATGTGFAGISAILKTALASGAFRTVTLYWGGASAADCYAADWLDELQRTHTGFHWSAVLSSAAATGYGVIAPTVPHRVQDAALAAGHAWERALVYACGNPAMVRDARDVLMAAGLPRKQFHSEAFLPAAHATEGGDAGKAPYIVRHPWEKVGAAFSLDGILEARRRSMAALRQIAALMAPGITTGDAIALADEQLRAMGAAYNWHPTYVRFGPDTQCTSREPVDRHRKLRADDLFTIDLGPVWNGYEGDYGDTFVMGADPDHQRCTQAARDVFEYTQQAWRQGLSGSALYDFADGLARRHGCALVRETAGHRVSDFPHALYGKHRLAEANFVPRDGIWVLEVQVRDLRRPIGAFFEDVLLRVPMEG
ncbi:M24 family metallopeptidase [Variovorax sp. RCC_210]|uniref:NAD(P)H dependent flavin oxidoreductase family protein n=1 Tax=Variovorax sp. RCC_210 TaxID=3239217 RepID=UPI003525769B